MLLGLAEGLGVYDDLMFGVDAGNPIVSLNHAFAGLDLGAFIVSDVALDGGAAFAGFVVMLIEPGLYFSSLFANRLHRLSFAFRLLEIGVPSIGIVMAFEDKAGSLLHLFLFFLKLPFGATPSLGCVAGQFAAVDGEHVATDQL